MGIEPYLIRSGLVAVVSQRLVRTLCPCARPSNLGDVADARSRLGLPVAPARVAVGCADCLGSGYRGRMVLAEWLDPAALAPTPDPRPRRPRHLEASAVAPGWSASGTGPCRPSTPA